MKLTFSDRLCILSICPDKDNVDRLCIRKELLNKVEISSEEFTGIEYKKIQVDNGYYYSWDKEKQHNYEIDIELSGPEKNYLISILHEINQKKEIHVSQLDFYMKICK